MKALVEKDIIMKKQEKEMRKAPHFFYVHLSRELEQTEGTRRNSREVKGSQGNLKELKGTWVSSREALVEVMEGKNSGKGAKRENLENLTTRRKEKT